MRLKYGHTESNQPLAQTVRALDILESINLALPIIFLIGILGTIFFHQHLVRNHEYPVLFFTRFLLLDAVHLSFTVFLVAFIPEMRKLITRAWAAKALWLYITLAMVVVLPVLFMSNKWRWINGGTYTVFLFILNITFLRHAIKQTFGISMLYNRRAQSHLTESQRKDAFRLEKLERLLFVALVPIVMAEVSYVSNTPWVHHGGFLIFSLLTTPIVLAYVWIMTQYKGVRWRNKKIYAARLFLFPLASTSNLALNVMAGLHGTEYLFLTLNFIKRSEATRKRLLALTLVIVALAWACFILHFYDVKIGTWIGMYDASSPTTSFGQAMLAIVFTLQYLHFQLDSVLFRAKNPMIRANLSSLLGLAPSPKSAELPAGPLVPELVQSDAMAQTVA